MDMANRVAKFSAAMLGGVVAGLTLVALSASAAAAKDCPTAPGAHTAPGEHWYYRIEHPSNRHCWYVRSEGQATEQGAAPVTAQLASQPTKPVTAPANTTLQRSVADARAEMPPDAAIPSDNTSATPTATVATNADVASTHGPLASDSPPRSLAERWSDHPAANDPVRTAPSGALAGANAPSQPAAALQSAELAAYAQWMMVSELAGALALVGIATLVIVHYRRRIAVEIDDEPTTSDAAWDEIAAGGPAATDETSISWIRIARETQHANQRRDEVEQLLSQMQSRPAV
jgi:hypothetical protein